MNEMLEVLFHRNRKQLLIATPPLFTKAFSDKYDLNRISETIYSNYSTLDGMQHFDRILNKKVEDSFNALAWGMQNYELRTTYIDNVDVEIPIVGVATSGNKLEVEKLF